MATNKLGLDWNPPDNAYSKGLWVAETALLLRGRAPKADPWLKPARLALCLHVISGKLHRIAERKCCEDLTCRECGGAGFLSSPGAPKLTCPRCKGEGDTLGRTVTRLRKAAHTIAQHYGLRAYFQTDPRGCSLYLLGESVKPGEEVSTYDRGYAVVRLGR